MEWIAETGLIALLAITLFHARRLERALGALKQDRPALEALIASFNAATGGAERATQELRQAADGGGRALARQLDAATRLRHDLEFLSDQGNLLADRLERVVRETRELDRERPPSPTLASPPRHAMEAAATAEAATPRSRAEQDLMRALRLAR